MSSPVVSWCCPKWWPAAAATSSTSRHSQACLAVPGQVVYAGTKFAVVGLSSGLSDEFAPHGVEVSWVVMPTFTNTELVAGTHTSAAGGNRWSPRTSRRPWSRCWRGRGRLASVPPWGRFFGTRSARRDAVGEGASLDMADKRWATTRSSWSFDAKARQAYETARTGRTGRRRGSREELAEGRERDGGRVPLDHLDVLEQLLQVGNW